MSSVWKSITYWRGDYIIVRGGRPGLIPNLKLKIAYCLDDIQFFKDEIERLAKFGWEEDCLDIYKKELYYRKQTLKKYEKKASVLLA